jgi:hypothetical protein
MDLTISGICSIDYSPNMVFKREFASRLEYASSLHSQLRTSTPLTLGTGWEDCEVELLPVLLAIRVNCLSPVLKEIIAKCTLLECVIHPDGRVGPHNEHAEALEEMPPEVRDKFLAQVVTALRKDPIEQKTLAEEELMRIRESKLFFFDLPRELQNALQGFAKAKARKISLALNYMEVLEVGYEYNKDISWPVHYLLSVIDELNEFAKGSERSG